MSFELYLTEPYFQRILATALIISATASVVGVFLVQRGMALFGDGVAHMSFAGIAVGFIFGWMPLGTAIVFAVLGALAVQELQRRNWARSDAALGIVYTASLALGVILISSRGTSVDMESYLLGSLLLAGPEEFTIAAIVAVIVGVSVLILWRPLVLLSMGEERAIVQGLPARALNGAFTVLTAMTVVATVRVVGVLLVSALIIMPASAASRIAKSMRQAVMFAMLFALVAVTVGLAISSQYNLASGATISLVAAAFFVGSVFLKP